VAAAILAGTGLALFELGTDRGFTGPYRPAHLEGTRVVPGDNR
jgi:hypothetical protein